MSGCYRHSAEWKREAHARGCCTQCGKPHRRLNRHTQQLARICYGCAETASKRAAARYREQKAKRRCVCGQPSAGPRGGRCIQCQHDCEPMSKRGVQPVSASEARFVELRLARLAAERRQMRGLSA